MTQAILNKAQEAVLHVIDKKSMTVEETVDKAHKSGKVSAEELEAAIYMLLHEGRIRFDGRYRLKRVGESA
ncbi:MAG: hypothetical protein JO170_18845 [Verrucomicrobia bacterium]|nr:hypothetical protein [Verrucomicrobiota bacterium]